VEQIVTQAEALLGQEVAASADVRVALPGGRVLTGTVGGLSGDAVRTTTYSRVAPKHRLTAWVRLLAITAADPSQEWRAVTIGRGPDDSVAVGTIPALGETEDERRATALYHLETLVDLHSRAIREPLPMACKTSAAYAAVRARGGDASRVARGKWESGYYAGEDDEAEHLLAFGGHRPFDDLIGEPPSEDERGRGWDASEPSRLGRYAVRLWTPLLEVEEMREL
jgi:exodeoxyribonuclease V gamma subunit